MEMRHTWREDTRRGDTWKREEGYNMYGEGTLMGRGQTCRGDYIRKGLRGERAHTEKGYTKKRLYREGTTREGNYAER